MRRSWRWLVLAVPAFAACAQVIGADFNGLLPEPGAGGSAGADPSGGPGGSAGDDGMPAGGSAGQGGGGASGGTAGAMKDATADNLGTGGATPDAAMDVDRKDVQVVLPDVVTGSVVINEIKGTGAGPDWIELHNPGQMPMVLDGYTVTQATGTNGPPDVAGFVTFPQGTTLAGGGFLMVVPDSTLPIGGPTTDCLGVAPTCFTANWGVSSGGERIYLLYPETDAGKAILQPVDYPALVVGQTYARAVDGMFQAAAPTPNQANGI